MILLLAAAWWFAQQEPTIRVDVQQVLVPVVVTDKKGHHVTGLRQGDFQLLEDGVPQEIVSLSSDVTATGPRHTFVICLDLLHASATDVTRMQLALENLFDKEKPSDAQYVLIGIGRQLQVLQSATTNPLEILLKVRGPAIRNGLGGLDDTALAADLSSVGNRMEELCRRCSCNARSNQRTCDAEIDSLKQDLDRVADRWDLPAKGEMKQLGAVVDELAKLPTARTLILVSGGLDANAKRDFYAAAAAYAPNAPQLRIENQKGVAPELDEALKTAAAKNITIYTIDSRRDVVSAPAKTGSMDASAPSASSTGVSMIGTNRSARPASPRQSEISQTTTFKMQESKSMEELARTTGGVYIHETGDLLKPLRSAIADGREYYVLAYVPKNSEHDGKFRAIKVVLKDEKLTMRAKTGYWAQ